MNHITLTEMRVVDSRIDYYFEVSSELQKYFNCYHLFYQYDRSIEGIAEGILVIPFLGTIMQLAWLTDAVVNVDVVDSVFAKSLHSLRDAYRKMYPNCPLNGDLKAKRQEDNRNLTVEGSAQLYSGGLDAVATFVRHKDEKPLLITEYGFYDERLFSGIAYEGDVKSHRNFSADKDAAQEFALNKGTTAAFVQANYGTFLNRRVIDKDFAKKMRTNFWFGLHHAMALLGAAAPIVVREKRKVLYIASSFTIGNTEPCASDPTTDNQFCFAASRVQHDGYELATIDKAQLVVRYQKEDGSPLHLRVCTWNDRNCCMCEKCMRRMLQIHAEGGNPAQFGFVYEGTLLQQLKKFLFEQVQFLSNSNVSWWKKTIGRMQVNYEIVFDKSVVDFLTEYNFEKEKKKGLWRYYRRNFFSILKRKIKGLFTKGN